MMLLLLLWWWWLFLRLLLLLLSLRRCVVHWGNRRNRELRGCGLCDGNLCSRDGPS